MPVVCVPGAIYAYKGNLTIEDAVFTANYAPFYGGKDAKRKTEKHPNKNGETQPTSANEKASTHTNAISNGARPSKDRRGEGRSS